MQQGDELSPEWARILFAPKKREYELAYYGKEREEDIIANTLAAPLQEIPTFGKKTDDWQNMRIFGDNLPVMRSLQVRKVANIISRSDPFPKTGQGTCLFHAAA